MPGRATALLLAWLAGMAAASVASAGGAAASELRHGGPVTAIARQGDTYVSAGFDSRLLVWPHDLGAALRARALAIGPIRQLFAGSLPGEAGGLAIVASSGIGADAGKAVALAGEQMLPIALGMPWVIGPSALFFVDQAGQVIRSTDDAATVIGRRDQPAHAMALAPNGRNDGRSGGASGVEAVPLAIAWQAAGIDVIDTAAAPGAGLIATLAGNELGTLCLAFVDPGRLLSAGSDGRLLLWSIRGARLLGEETAHDAPIVSLAVSRDGRLAATGGANGTLTLWDIDDDAVTARAVIAQRDFPLLALLMDEAEERVVIGTRDGRLEAVPLDGSTAIKAPPRPARLFAHAESDDRGARLFNACRACHSVTADDEGKAGPTFFGLIGRRAGSVHGYPYSDALKGSTLVWSATTLSALFENGPESYVPGSAMPLQRLPDPDDRAALIAHILELSQKEAHR